ncbi:GNAT family N-acetyltransferase [Aureliella helgolandensis]|uniref:Mycothiol acetyltransferase n=1 Tax=Aureliella helgolandensis TaxID=2527968 RepID=A0A518GCC5_9BACT|nr:GNAT family N-acetyltransferase [Aureliella helgolandensis]QDV26252.1 Mycothiol acetyltransferase [Aureliella helgolandensis]
MGELQASGIEPAELLQLLNWIQIALPHNERRARLGEAIERYRQGPFLQPSQVVSGSKRLAAAYFVPLPGQVATLGGVRCVSGQETLAIELLRQSANKARQLGLSQIQAVVPQTDSITPKLLHRAGFTKLTTVSHLTLELNGTSTQKRPASPGNTAAPTQGMFRSARELSSRRLAYLIHQTFEGTLDCPALNGKRDHQQVLAGFLDGQPLRQQAHWFTLHTLGPNATGTLVSSELAGCLLLNPHGNELVELSYLGLLPSMRGQGFGRQLVSQAIDVAQSLKASLLVAAVDDANTPALSIYQQFGFTPHQSFSVWLQA